MGKGKGERFPHPHLRAMFWQTRHFSDPLRVVEDLWIESTPAPRLPKRVHNQGFCSTGQLLSFAKLVECWFVGRGVPVLLTNTNPSASEPQGDQVDVQIDEKSFGRVQLVISCGHGSSKAIHVHALPQHGKRLEHQGRTRNGTVNLSIRLRSHSHNSRGSRNA